MVALIVKAVEIAEPTKRMTKNGKRDRKFSKANIMTFDVGWKKSQNSRGAVKRSSITIFTSITRNQAMKVLMGLALKMDQDFASEEMGFSPVMMAA